MEIKHMHVVVGLTIIFLLALGYFLEMSSRPAGPTGEELAEALLLKAISLGENATSYIYSYTEYSDGFPETYTLTSDGISSSVEVVNALSKKTVYFLGNDTILCVDFQGNQSCSSVKDETVTAGYVSSLRGRLFSREKAEKARSDVEYRVERELQVFSPMLKTKILSSGEECIEIHHVMDYSNATMEEMGRFNIVAGGPAHFETTQCIENQTGELYESRFNYTFMGRLHSSRFEMIGSDFDSDAKVIPPANLSGDAVELILTENSYKLQLVDCYLKPGSEQERCIAMMALQMKSTDLCGYAGARKDRCLVSIVPYLKDESICQQVENANFKDDCFIELAGAFKNSSWCDQVGDGTKKQYCLKVSEETPTPETGPLIQNETGNTTMETEMPGEIISIFGKLENQSNNSSG